MGLFAYTVMFYFGVPLGLAGWNGSPFYLIFSSMHSQLLALVR